MALVLDRLVDGDLAGMFDGPTTEGIDLSSPLIVFDLSAIDRNSIGMPILMAIVGVWLEHTWLRPDRVKRILLVEEAWHIINSPFVAQLFQRLLKFGRRLGLSFVAVVHHLSDVVDGAAAKEASAILKMASTRTVYMQKADEARTTGRVLGLPRWAVEIIPSLSPGIAVWDVNGDVQVVKHIVTEHERPLVFTDRAMTESSVATQDAELALAEAAGTPLPPQARLTPQHPRRAIAGGNQQPVDRSRRSFIPMAFDEEDELTAIAGMLFGKQAELPYMSPEEHGTPEERARGTTGGSHALPPPSRRRLHSGRSRSRAAASSTRHGHNPRTCRTAARPGRRRGAPRPCGAG